MLGHACIEPVSIPTDIMNNFYKIYSKSYAWAMRPSDPPVVFYNLRDGGVETNLRRIHVDCPFMFSYRRNPGYDFCTGKQIIPNSGGS